VTIKLDSSFKVTSTDDGFGRGPANGGPLHDAPVNGGPVNGGPANGDPRHEDHQAPQDGSSTTTTN
jgi:hypothetical protein